MNLYQIQTEYRELVARIEAAGGELSPELEFELKLNEHNFTDKAIAYCAVITERDIDIDGLDAEIARLQLMRDRAKRTIAKLKEKLLEAVIERGPQTVGLWELRTFKSHSVEVNLPADLLPDGCKRTTVEPDKAAIKAKLHAGETVPGCKLVEKQNLIIK